MKIGMMVVDEGLMHREVHFNDKVPHEPVTTDHPVGKIVGWFICGGAMLFLIEHQGQMTTRRPSHMLFKEF